MHLVQLSRGSSFDIIIDRRELNFASHVLDYTISADYFRSYSDVHLLYTVSAVDDGILSGRHPYQGSPSLWYGRVYHTWFQRSTGVNWKSLIHKQPHTAVTLWFASFKYSVAIKPKILTDPLISTAKV